MKIKTKTIITIFTIILSITIVSAYYAGETFTKDFGFEIVNCSIIGNSSNLDGLNLSLGNTNVTIYTVPNYKPDNFSISCWVIKYGEVVKAKPVWYSFGVKVAQGPYGGGSCGIEKDFDWNCSEWSECAEGQQTRTCKEKNNCGDTYERPDVTKICSTITKEDCTNGYIWNETNQECIEEKEEQESSLLGWVIIGIISLILLTIFIIVVIKKPKKKKPKKKKNEKKNN